MKPDKTLLWIFGGIAAAFALLFFASDLPLEIFRGGPSKPVPGKVYQLTSDNRLRQRAILVPS